MASKSSNQIITALAYLLLTAYAILSIYPFLWMISSALKSNQEVLGSQSLIPSAVDFNIIINTWNQLDFFKYFINSLIIVLISVVAIILIYSMAGFGFSKTNFAGKNVLFICFLGLLFVPGVTVLVPLVQMLRALGFIGRDATQTSTYAGLILPMINGAGPLSIFLFRNYFNTLPNDLYDAARVDGASMWRIYLRIFLPLATPIIATITILNFIGIWNGFIWPSIVLNNPDWYTLPLKLKDLDLQIVIQWNVRMAGSLIMIVPVIIAFLLLQRYYISGLTAGAVRG